MAGLGNAAVLAPELAEWTYGEYEALTPEQIHEKAPDWLISATVARAAKCESKWVRG